MSFKFENLKVWHEAIEFTDDVYKMTSNFPNGEMFGLVSQMRRAASSIALNISEGATGNSNPEFKRFLTMASRSCAEIISCLYIVNRRAYISTDEFQLTYNKIEMIYKKINKLKSSIR